MDDGLEARSALIDPCFESLTGFLVSGVED